MDRLARDFEPLSNVAEALSGIGSSSLYHSTYSDK